MSQNQSNTQKQSTIVFTYHNPGRTFDGTPYEAASKAVTQTSNVVKLLQRSIRDTHIQVRNAWMQRNIDLGDEPRADDWTGTTEYKMLVTFLNASEMMTKKLAVLNRAAAYNPKAPPKE